MAALAPPSSRAGPLLRRFAAAAQAALKPQAEVRFFEGRLGKEDCAKRRRELTTPLDSTRKKSRHQKTHKQAVPPRDPDSFRARDLVVETAERLRPKPRLEVRVWHRDEPAERRR